MNSNGKQNVQSNKGYTSQQNESHYQFQDLDFQPILSYEEQQDIDQFLNQLVTEDFCQAPQPYPSYPNYPIHSYPRMNPPTPYLINVSHNQMHPPVPAGPLIQSNPLFTNQLFESPKIPPPHQHIKSSKPAYQPMLAPPRPLDSPVDSKSPSSYISANFCAATNQELSEDQKKINHIKSEKKRRQIIRQGFGKLEYFLFEKQPGIQFTANQQVKSRSEATMLKLTVEYIQNLIQSYKNEYVKLLKNEFILGIKSHQEVKNDLARLAQDPTFNILYKTQQKIRTYKRVVYNNNKIKNDE
eukprot:NODE_85_length_22318_cov_0.288492.p7 type:complete len:298 gc:universal NODE_85_length_22318_cov_0.288492:21344-20451(-)